MLYVRRMAHAPPVAAVHACLPVSRLVALLRPAPPSFIATCLNAFFVCWPTGTRTSQLTPAAPPASVNCLVMSQLPARCLHFFLSIRSAPFMSWWLAALAVAAAAQARAPAVVLYAQPNFRQELLPLAAPGAHALPAAARRTRSVFVGPGAALVLSTREAEPEVAAAVPARGRCVVLHGPRASLPLDAAWLQPQARLHVIEVPADTAAAVSVACDAFIFLKKNIHRSIVRTRSACLR